MTRASSSSLVHSSSFSSSSSSLDAPSLEDFIRMNNEAVQLLELQQVRPAAALLKRALTQLRRHFLSLVVQTTSQTQRRKVQQEHQHEPAYFSHSRSGASVDTADEEQVDEVVLSVSSSSPSGSPSSLLLPTPPTRSRTIMIPEDFSFSSLSSEDTSFLTQPSEDTDNDDHDDEDHDTSCLSSVPVLTCLDPSSLLETCLVMDMYDRAFLVDVDSSTLSTCFSLSSSSCSTEAEQAGQQQDAEEDNSAPLSQPITTTQNQNTQKIRNDEEVLMVTETTNLVCGILMYNLALIFHGRGVTQNKSKHVHKARSMYTMARNILAATTLTTTKIMTTKTTTTTTTIQSTKCPSLSTTQSSRDSSGGAGRCSRTTSALGTGGGGGGCRRLSLGRDKHLLNLAVLNNLAHIDAYLCAGDDVHRHLERMRLILVQLLDDAPSHHVDGAPQPNNGNNSVVSTNDDMELETVTMDGQRTNVTTTGSDRLVGDQYQQNQQQQPHATTIATSATSSASSRDDEFNWFYQNVVLTMWSTVTSGGAVLAMAPAA